MINTHATPFVTMEQNFSEEGNKELSKACTDYIFAHCN